MKITEQQSICTRPFEWFEIHPDGSVFLCCPAWLKRSIGNLLLQSTEKIWNGPVAREIRKSILNGSFHNCTRSRCPHLTNKTAPVCPTATIEQPQLRKALTERHSKLDYRPQQLNLCFDHSCNLACPSCRTKIQQAQGDELARCKKVATIIETELLPHARSVTMSGFGDPFGSRSYLQLLRKLNRREYPLLEQVRLHSNGQLLSEQMWQSLPDLQPLVSEIELSIDAATEQTYQRNRPGGSLSKLLRNLEFLSTVNIKLTLSMVVQKNNWREVPQFIELAKHYGAGVYLSQLVNWGTFNKEDFLQRAVHLPEHPEYQQAKQLLSDLAAKNRQISSNLPFLANGR